MLTARFGQQSLLAENPVQRKTPSLSSSPTCAECRCDRRAKKSTLWNPLSAAEQRGCGCTREGRRAPTVAAITSTVGRRRPSSLAAVAFFRLFFFPHPPLPLPARSSSEAVGETTRFIHSRYEVGQSPLCNVLIIFGTQVFSICHTTLAPFAPPPATSAWSRSFVGSVSEVLKPFG